ncbi:MAG: glycosyl hydrolase, partial [Bacteroidetes bacterium]|nr:glycosyl hydrolase [Bacteroidota bacterium]
PIRDLVVKDNDVVLGSHGRGFWILDDIGHLREVNQDLTQKEAILFQPSDPIRGIYDATIQYYLADTDDSISLEILDEAGNIIQSFSGSAIEFKPDPNFPGLLRGGSGIPIAKGMNTFTWDLRYPGATTFDDMIIWSARPARGPKAPLGKYQVRLKTGNFEDTKTFTIKIDPNLKGVTKEDLQQQFDLSMKIRDKTSTANEAVIEIRQLREKVEKAIEKTDNESVHNSAKALLKEMAEVELNLYQVQNRSNQDPLNFPIKLNNRLASLRRSVETGDARPTNGAYKVFEELSAELDTHLLTLKNLKSKQLNSLNQLLKNNGLPIID